MYALPKTRLGWLLVASGVAACIETPPSLVVDPAFNQEAGRADGASPPADATADAAALDARVADAAADAASLDLGPTGGAVDAMQPTDTAASDAGPTADAGPIADMGATLDVGVTPDVGPSPCELPGAVLSDADSDGVRVCAGDCDDADPAIGPGEDERCNGRDDDCDGATDEAPSADAAPLCPLAPHATGVCQQGECVLRCDCGRADVDGVSENGCERGCDLRCVSGSTPAQWRPVNDALGPVTAPPMRISDIVSVDFASAQFAALEGDQGRVWSVDRADAAAPDFADRGSGARPRGVVDRAGALLVASLRNQFGRVRAQLSGVGERDEVPEQNSGPPALTVRADPELLYVASSGILKRVSDADLSRGNIGAAVHLGGGWRPTELVALNNMGTLHVVGAESTGLLRHAIVTGLVESPDVDVFDALEPVAALGDRPVRCGGAQATSVGLTTADGDGEHFVYACVDAVTSQVVINAGVLVNREIVFQGWRVIADLDAPESVWAMRTPSGPQLIVRMNGAQTAVYFDDALEETGRAALPDMSLIRPTRDPTGVLRLGWANAGLMDWTPGSACDL